MLRRLGLIGGLTLLSRLLGFIRDLIMAGVLGAGPIADAFMLAFRLPNHFRAIFAEGAFNAAFLPTYAATLEKDGPDKARHFGSQILSWLMLANLALLAFAWAATGTLITLLAPGLGAEDPARPMAIELTRITFPYLLCMSIVVLLSAVLNAERRFAAAAAAPVLLNIAMIGTLLAVSQFPDAGSAAAWGVLAGGIAQVLLLTAATFRSEFSVSFCLPKLDPGVRLFFRRLGPALLASGVVQIAIFADTILASFLPSGALSHLYYADRLYQLPLGVIGIALGTALLPEVSRGAAAETDEARQKLRATMDQAFNICLAVGLPVAVLMAGLGELAIAAFFQRGAFDAAATAGAGAVLLAYSLGLPAALAVRSLVASFHGRGDMVTPLKILAVATLVNVALKATLSGPWEAAGLAAGTSAGVWIYAMGLYLTARHRDYMGTPPARLTALLLTGTVLMAGLMLLQDQTLVLFSSLLPQSLGALVPFATLTLLAGAALGLYAVMLYPARGFLRRRRR
ncbi:murein biosynthesis integral membrane protein MurJ [Pannonibacter phragmitetus]|uniref:murein biosynthesis integral membrane protein MurJ n=1 Tax=Pannonibacter phragmitetus TaxID=121719 RepID=UPI000F01328E|nr:murein biosynthesis integral membrane protein MurJ [Pannonibacter phragmitetus]